MPLVTIKDLSIRFRGPLLLDEVSCHLDAGQRIGLLGRNGAGKSTFVSALSGYTPGDAGYLRIADVEINLNGSNYAPRIRDVIAHVQQTPQLFPLLSVAENLFLEHDDVRGRFGTVNLRVMTERRRLC